MKWPLRWLCCYVFKYRVVCWKGHAGSGRNGVHVNRWAGMGEPELVVPAPTTPFPFGFGRPTMFSYHTQITVIGVRLCTGTIVDCCRLVGRSSFSFGGLFKTNVHRFSQSNWQYICETLIFEYLSGGIRH